MIEAYYSHLLISICIFLVLTLALQITAGFTGLLNLGHIAFFGIGAYTSALLTMNGVNFIPAFVLAGICAMLFGFMLALPLNKLKGDYFALATMGFSIVIYAVLLNWTGLTNGPIGLSGIPKPSFFGLSLNSNLAFLVLALVITIGSYLLIKRMLDSPFGRVLEAIRDDELAAKVLGKDTFRMKGVALGVSAFFAGIAGSLYANYITYIDPSAFSIMQLVPVLAIVIIAGLASLKGTIIATFILVLLPESLRFLGLPLSIVGPARQIIFAVILLIILLYKPKGFFGKVELE